GGAGDGVDDDGQVLVAILVDVHAGDGRGGFADGEDRGGGEGGLSPGRGCVQDDRDGTAGRVGGDEVAPAMAVEVARDNLDRTAAGGDADGRGGVEDARAAGVAVEGDRAAGDAGDHQVQVLVVVDVHRFDPDGARAGGDGGGAEEGEVGAGPALVD